MKSVISGNHLIHTGADGEHYNVEISEHFIVKLEDVLQGIIENWKIKYVHPSVMS
jgi:hypothetical protein